MTVNPKCLGVGRGRPIHPSRNSDSLKEYRAILSGLQIPRCHISPCLKMKTQLSASSLLALLLESPQISQDPAGGPTVNLGIFRTECTILDPGCSRAPRNWPPLSSLGHQAPLTLPFHDHRKVPSLCEESRGGVPLFFLLSTRQQGHFALLLVYPLPWRLCNGKKPTFFCWPRDIFASLGQFLAISSFKTWGDFKDWPAFKNTSAAYPHTSPCARCQGAPRYLQSVLSFIFSREPSDGHRVKTI